MFMPLHQLGTAPMYSGGASAVASAVVAAPAHWPHIDEHGSVASRVAVYEDGAAPSYGLLHSASAPAPALSTASSTHTGGPAPHTSTHAAPAMAATEAAADTTEPPPPPVRRNVYISGLTAPMSSAEFRELCQRYGPVEASKLCVGGQANPSKGYGFALFLSEESAAACIRDLQGSCLHGRCLQARLADAQATPAQARGHAKSSLHPPLPRESRGRRGSAAQRSVPSDSSVAASNTSQAPMSKDAVPTSPLVGLLETTALAPSGHTAAPWASGNGVTSLSVSSGPTPTAPPLNTHAAAAAAPVYYMCPPPHHGYTAVEGGGGACAPVPTTLPHLFDASQAVMLPAAPTSPPQLHACVYSPSPTYIDAPLALSQHPLMLHSQPSYPPRGAVYVHADGTTAMWAPTQPAMAPVHELYQPPPLQLCPYPGQLTLVHPHGAVM